MASPLIAKGKTETLESLINRFRLTQIHFEPADLTLAELTQFKAQFPKIKFLPAPALVEQLRLIKTPTEIRFIKAACRLASSAMRHLARLIKPGLTEAELAWQAQIYLHRHDAPPAFPTIIASGPNSATPHYQTGHRKIKTKDIVLIDLGCQVSGYCSDITRVFFIGPPTPQQQNLYDLVQEAHTASLKHLRGGRMSKSTSEVAEGTPRTVDVDRAARQVITRAGYGKYFVHGTGHGLGLDIHEAPSINQKSPPQPLNPGMVFTIEPGIYLPHRFGIRLEDTILLTPTGPRPLTRSPFLPTPPPQTIQSTEKKIVS